MQIPHNIFSNSVKKINKIQCIANLRQINNLILWTYKNIEALLKTNAKPRNQTNISALIPPKIGISYLCIRSQLDLFIVLRHSCNDLCGNLV